MKRACAALPLLAALPGCAGIQSALAPEGPDAERIAILTLVLIVGAFVITAIVMAALAIALRGPERWRQGLAGRGAIIWGGLVFPVVTLAVALAYGLWLMLAEATPLEKDPLRIEVTGEQWWWRVAYRRADGTRIEEANEIRIPVGREVAFVLASADVIHSFWVPSLGGKLDAIPGRINTLRLKADRPGIYRGQCAEYCGGPHAFMALEVVAVPQAEFDAWLAAPPAGEPQSEPERRGAALFRAAGCGACHAIRGTEAAGVIGPDLSRMGERRFLAAAMLRTSPETIAEFVHDGQRVKPGNLMPPFRIFTPDERHDLALYLMSRK